MNAVVTTSLASPVPMTRHYKRKVECQCGRLKSHTARRHCRGCYREYQQYLARLRRSERALNRMWPPVTTTPNEVILSHARNVGARRS
jgi:hypothetical protein